MYFFQYSVSDLTFIYSVEDGVGFGDGGLYLERSVSNGCPKKTKKSIPIP